MEDLEEIPLEFDAVNIKIRSLKNSKQIEAIMYFSSILSKGPWPKHGQKSVSGSFCMLLYYCKDINFFPPQVNNVSLISDK